MQIKETEKYLVRFILVAMCSEVIAHRLLTGDKIMLPKLISSTKDIINTPINNLIHEIIENFKDMELENILEEDLEEIDNLTSDEEWFDKVCELVEHIKEDVK